MNLKDLELYSLPYTDEQLNELAHRTDGTGEISPITAKLEIICRCTIAKAKGKTK